MWQKCQFCVKKSNSFTKDEAHKTIDIMRSILRSDIKLIEIFPNFFEIFWQTKDFGLANLD